jgi:pyruvate formate lyase activating enzyme
MIFGGVQKNSLIDYPTKVSCVLFTQGCNFRCPYCHNPQLVPCREKRAPVFPEDEVLSFLAQRKNWLDGVVITGGEPTLQKDLFDFCGQLKEMGFSIKLDTNGSRPDVIRKLINGRRVDYIAMDIKTDPARYAPVFTATEDVECIRNSIETILASGLDHEFRTTCVKPFVDADIIRIIGHSIAGADRYVLQQARCIEGHALDPEFFKTPDWRMDAALLSVLCEIGAGFVKACRIRLAPEP